MTESTQVVLPIVNNNGTSKAELLDPIFKAYRATLAAYEALCKTAPHGRDYQISPPEDYPMARRDFERRAKELMKISEELQALYIGIERQGRGL